MIKNRPINHSKARKGRGGRPKTADLEKLNENILAVAGELFLEHGFDGTSMDSIAARARISKRTLYSRYDDKWTLFNSVMYDLLGRILAPIQNLHENPRDLASTLLPLGRDLVSNALKPEHLAVHRVITCEMQRRPEFGRWINDAFRKPGLQVIVRLLDRHRYELRVADFEAAAEQFSNLTFDSAVRLASLGIKLSPRAIYERVGSAVDLFLSGVRLRDPDRLARGLVGSRLDDDPNRPKRAEKIQDRSVPS
jgi:AcrR family transcriptional regulator